MPWGTVLWNLTLAWWGDRDRETGIKLRNKEKKKLKTDAMIIKLLHCVYAVYQDITLKAVANTRIRAERAIAFYGYCYFSIRCTQPKKIKR